MRLTPIETPPTLMLRLAYRMSRRRLGKVMSPLKVVYARAPKALRMGYEISKYAEKGVALEPEVRLLVQAYVAGLNKCGFCVDIARAMAMRHRLDMDRVSALDGFEDDSRFSERERAALCYVGEATRDRRVSDDTFARVREHFPDHEIVELTLLCAVEHFYNLVNIPLGIESDGLCAIRDSSSPRRAAETA